MFEWSLRVGMLALALLNGAKPTWIFAAIHKRTANSNRIDLIHPKDIVINRKAGTFRIWHMLELLQRVGMLLNGAKPTWIFAAIHKRTANSNRIELIHPKGIVSNRKAGTFRIWHMLDLLRRVGMLALALLNGAKPTWIFAAIDKRTANSYRIDLIHRKGIVSNRKAGTCRICHMFELLLWVGMLALLNGAKPTWMFAAIHKRTANSYRIELIHPKGIVSNRKAGTFRIWHMFESLLQVGMLALFNGAKDLCSNP